VGVGAREVRGERCEERVSDPKEGRREVAEVVCR
jgi:hypothetical protein